jgi:SAM-dependent methyltransferase
METYSFSNDGRVYPENIMDVDDPYHTQKLPTGTLGPMRFIVKFQKVSEQTSTIQENLLTGSTVNFKENSWKFDETVADRFEEEAVNHIPSYHLVIDKCLDFARTHLNKTDRIIDVGSALGYTIKRFNDDGFTNVVGVDNSESMISASYRPDLVTLSNVLPKGRYKMVMANWTLHFVKDKTSYFKDVYDCLPAGGYFILTDKTTQTAMGKQLYYDFKRKNGVSEEYITSKEQQLKGIMHTMPVEWYLDKLRLTKFTTIDIVYSDLGFTTFLCVK